MSEQSLTLYLIDTGILEQLQRREGYIESADLSADERSLLVFQCDNRIMELLEKEIAKVDGVSYNLMEFERRADILYDEAKRLKARGDQQQARHDRLQTMVISIMQMMGKTELEGQNSTLKLRANPPKVEVTQEGLLPAEYRRTTVTLDQQTWDRIYEALCKAGDPAAKLALASGFMKATTEPKKLEIARVLKSTEPCSKCAGYGAVCSNTGEPWTVCACGMCERGPSTKTDCDLCKGTRSIPRGVPGARLVSGVRLEVR